MRALIVDNSLANGLVARSILARDGHDVAIATNGHHALQLIRDENFDAVLLDIVMPGLDGIEIGRILQSTDRPLRTPTLLAMTAYHRPEDIRAYKDTGLHGLIAKPLRPGDLSDAVNTVRAGGYPLLNCHRQTASDDNVRPLLDTQVIEHGPGRADDITRAQIWRYYRAGLSESLREISKSLPGTVSGSEMERARLLKALHGLRSASLMVGLDRAPSLADHLRQAPNDQIIPGMTALLQAVRDSLPCLETALMHSTSVSVTTGQEAGRVQVR